MANTIEVLYAKFQEQNLKGRIVSAHHLKDLQDEIEGHHAKGHFDAEFYREGLSSFSFQPPENLFNCKWCFSGSITDGDSGKDGTD